MSVFQQTYPKDEVIAALTVPGTIAEHLTSYFAPAYLESEPCVIARILHYTYFSRKNSTGFNHVPLDLLYMVFVVYRHIPFDWTSHILSFFYKPPSKFLPFPNVVELFASQSLRSFSPSLFVPMDPGNRYTAETLAWMKLRRLKVGRYWGRTPPPRPTPAESDDGSDGDTPEDTSNEDIPVAPPSPPPRQPPPFDWSFYNGHLAPDFDVSAFSSMGALVGGVSALAYMFASFRTEVRESFCR